jgi:hypothetical protein
VKLVEDLRPSHRIGLVSVARADMAKPGSAETRTTPASEPRRGIRDMLIRRVSRTVQGLLIPDASRTVQERATHLWETESMRQSLLQQWSLDLNGPTASLELMYSHGKEVGASTARRQEAGSGASHVFNRHIELDNKDSDVQRQLELQSAPRLPLGQNQSGDTGYPGPDSDVQRQLELQSAPRLPLGQNQSGDTGYPGPDERGFAQPLQARFALPAQPEPVDQPGSLLRSGPAEVESFDWNLSTLSLAMKRILDEDARRHGVDVEEQG